ncbi:MAG TPA: matrixin family metalloprotease [Terriglobia bacterium]|nr:matrixin family metalloprotease [Terriglobia bacterium]
MSRVQAWKLALKSLALLAAVAGLGWALLLFAYNHEQDDVNGPVAAKWCNDDNGTACNNTVSWSLNPATGTNINASGGESVQTAIQNAFNSWKQAQLNGQSLVNLTIAQLPNNSLTGPNSGDCQNTIGFEDSTKSDFPTGTIAFTQIATSFGCTVAGPNCPVGSPPNTYTCPNSANPNTPHTCPLPSCIIDADIEFNPADQFTTSATLGASAYDVQAIATHEIGHLLGMDHSGLASAIMFAYGDTGGVAIRSLSLDDAIGMGALYPGSNYATLTGTLSGQVTLSGAGVFAAHVVVIDAATGNAVTDGLTDTSGNYQIAGVPPGSYNVLALPLAGIYTLSNFSGWACGFGDNVPPCCDPTSDPSCNKSGALKPHTNYSGKFY